MVDLNGNDYTYDPSPKGNHVNDGGVVALRYPVDHLEDVLRVTKNNFDTNSVTRHTDGSLISSGKQFFCFYFFNKSVETVAPFCVCLMFTYKKNFNVAFHCRMAFKSATRRKSGYL